MKSYDANIELQILKSALESAQKYKILSQVTVEHFGSDSSREVYNRIMSLVGSGKIPPSSDVMKGDGALSAPAQAFIGSPNARVLSTEHDIDAALEILGKYRKGRLLLASITDAISVLKADDPNIDGVVAGLETALQRCHSGSRRDEMLHINADNLPNLLKVFDDQFNSPIDDVIPSGFKEFDKKTGGFRKKNVIALASVPGGGKSAMAEQMAINQYMMGHNVCICTWEMDKDELLGRMWSCLSKVNHSDINLRRINAKTKMHVREKWEEFVKSSGLKNRLTFFYPEREMNVPEIAMELKPFGYDIIYIDYIGLLKQDPNKQMWESLGDHARSAKLAANSLNAAVVLLAQFDDESNKLKYSKAIVANAHFVWAWDNNEEERQSGVVKIRQLKARNAEVYEFYLQRDFSTMTFGDYSGIPVEQLKKNAEPKKAADIPRMPELAN